MLIVPEKYRVKTGSWGSTKEYGNNGLFIVPVGGVKKANVICGVGEGWEHVSVTLVGKKATPSWNTMCIIKSLFWGDDDVVIQYHPAKKDYVNRHEYCLHLWRPVDCILPTPPIWMI